MNPHGEYELIKAKSDPRAEVRLRWVKVVGATYNGGPDLPSTSVVALRNRIRPHPQLAEGLEMLLQVIPGCYWLGVTRFAWDVLQIQSGLLHLNHG